MRLQAIIHGRIIYDIFARHTSANTVCIEWLCILHISHQWLITIIWGVSRRAEAFILFHSLVLLRVGLSWLMNVGLWIEKEPQPKYNVVIEWILDLPCFEPRKVGIDKSHCLVFYFHNFQAQTIIIYYINISEIRTPNDCCSVKVYKNDVAPSPRKWWWERSII